MAAIQSQTEERGSRSAKGRIPYPPLARPATSSGCKTPECPEAAGARFCHRSGCLATSDGAEAVAIRCRGYCHAADDADEGAGFFHRGRCRAADERVTATGYIRGRQWHCATIRTLHGPKAIFHEGGKVQIEVSFVDLKIFSHVPLHWISLSSAQARDKLSISSFAHISFFALSGSDPSPVQTMARNVFPNHIQRTQTSFTNRKPPPPPGRN